MSAPQGAPPKKYPQAPAGAAPPGGGPSTKKVAGNGPNPQGQKSPGPGPGQKSPGPKMAGPPGQKSPAPPAGQKSPAGKSPAPPAGQKSPAGKSPAPPAGQKSPAGKSPAPPAGQKSPAGKSPAPPAGQKSPAGAGPAPAPNMGPRKVPPPTGGPAPPGAAAGGKKTPSRSTTPTGPKAVPGSATPGTPGSAGTPSRDGTPVGKSPVKLPGGPPPGFKGAPPPGFKGAPPPGFKGAPPPGFKGAPPPGFKGAPPPGFKGAPPPGMPPLSPPSPVPPQSAELTEQPPPPPSPPPPEDDIPPPPPDAPDAGPPPRESSYASSVPQSPTSQRPPEMSEIHGVSPIPREALGPAELSTHNAPTHIDPARVAERLSQAQQQSAEDALGQADAEARKRLMMQRRLQAKEQSVKKTSGPLTVDPRTNLPIIDFPNDRQHAFANLRRDVILHIFLDCDRISSKSKPLRRVAFVTDRTMFVCEETGAPSRMVQVNKISLVNKANDNSNEIALVIPSEYDIILRLERKEQRDNLIAVLKAIYLRMTSTELNVQTVKEIRPSQYRMEKPPGFQPQNIPQRTRAHLQKSLDSIEQQRQERIDTIAFVQKSLEQQHGQERMNKEGEIQRVQEKLNEALERQRQQMEELEKWGAAFVKCKKRREEIESQMGAHGQTPINKDVKIKELQEVVEALQQSEQRAREERQRLEHLRQAGDFEQIEIDNMEPDIPRLRGRSLHQQGLIEVMQRQIRDRNREIDELTKRKGTLAVMQTELRQREDQLRDLEQQLPAHLTSQLYKVTNEMPLSASALAPTADTSLAGGSRAGARPTSVMEYLGYSTLAPEDDGGDIGGEVSPMSPTRDKRLDVPDTLSLFVKDPRTNLAFVKVPDDITGFSMLNGTVLFFFAECHKVNKRGREEPRLIAVTDRLVIVFAKNGGVSRVIRMADICKIEYDKDQSVVLYLNAKDEYDLLLKFKQKDGSADSTISLSNFIDSITKNYRYFLGTPLTTVFSQDRIEQHSLKLEKPPHYKPPDKCSLLKRDVLFQQLQRASQRMDPENYREEQNQQQMTQQIENRIRADLMPVMEMMRESEFANLRSKVEDLDRKVRGMQEEVHRWRRKIDEHRCSFATLGASESFPTQFETQGMYWIPTDPVQIECKMAILNIQFYENLVVTSHANGTINIWQIQTASLFRTLRTGGHTARVETFHYNGQTLISGGFDSSLRRWSVSEGVCVHVQNHAHNGPVTGVQFDSRKCISSGGDGKLVVWELSETSPVLTKKKTLTGHSSGVVCFKFDGNTLASADWGWIFLWDIDRGIVLKTLRDENGGVLSLDMHGITLITGGTGGCLTVWNTNTTESSHLDGHTDDIHCVQLQGNFAVSSSSDGRILMWQVKDLVSLGVFHNCAPRECKRFHFHANRFAVGEDTVIKVWTR